MRMIRKRNKNVNLLGIFSFWRIPYAKNRPKAVLKKSADRALKAQAYSAQLSHLALAIVLQTYFVDQIDLRF